MGLTISMFDIIIKIRRKLEERGEEDGKRTVSDIDRTNVLYFIVFIKAKLWG